MVVAATAIPCRPIRPLSVARSQVWVGACCNWSSPTNHSFPHCQTRDCRFLEVKPIPLESRSTGRALGLPVSFYRGGFRPCVHGPAVVVVVCSAQAVALRRCAIALRYSSLSARRRPSLGPGESWCRLPSAGSVVVSGKRHVSFFWVDIPSFRRSPLRDLASSYTPPGGGADTHCHIVKPK